MAVMAVIIIIIIIVVVVVAAIVAIVAIAASTSTIPILNDAASVIRYKQLIANQVGFFNPVLLTITIKLLKRFALYYSIYYCSTYCSTDVETEVKEVIIFFKQFVVIFLKLAVVVCITVQHIFFFGLFLMFSDSKKGEKKILKKKIYSDLVG